MGGYHENIGKVWFQGFIADDQFWSRDMSSAPFRNAPLLDKNLCHNQNLVSSPYSLVDLYKLVPRRLKT